MLKGMGKIKQFSVISCALLFLTACGTETVTQEGGAQSVLSDLSGYENAFVLGTDDQPDCVEYTAYTEDGYYFFEQVMGPGWDGYFLWFHDDASGAEVPVCGKTDCTHETADCNAYFASDKYLFGNQLWYYNDALYHFCEDEGYYAIEKVSLDGSQRSISCRLYRTSSETVMDDDGTLISGAKCYPTYILHRGYVYFSTDSPADEDWCGLYRVKLDSSESSKLLCMQEGNDPTLYRLKGYGNGVFFQKGDFYNEDFTEFDISLYVFDIETETISLVAENVIRNYTVGNGGIYYMDYENRDSLMKYTPSTQETIMLMDSHGEDADDELEIFAKDGYVYYTEPSLQTVYDDEGNVVQTYEGGDIVVPYAAEE